MDLFVAENISKRFSNHLALEDVSVIIPQGSIYGLLGPNGAGKTTLLRIVNQITGPDTGELFFNGRKLKADDVYNIGYLPEERGLYRKMKVGEQVVYLSRLKGLSKNDALQKSKYWFEKFQIEDWWGKKVEELSKGMQQKIQFIITVLHEPELLIFDEPFSGFDPINANLLKNEILDLRNQGATVIFSTHNMSSVEELCSDISLINRSKIILEGNIQSIRSQYKSNTFKVVFSDDQEKLTKGLTDSFSIVEIKHKQGLNEALIQLNVGTGNELLKNLVSLVHVISFQEVIPGMNDIFIQVVEQSNLAA
ncbi:MAG: ATP-binding cassette domain-containing protein [Bacteroidetes bacterium]|jgi:ABC-2 type transport system ATP-binding protein|nr:ATP-binding cassette domain-containing protein [Bacteroidota bacterium]